MKILVDWKITASSGTAELDIPDSEWNNMSQVDRESYVETEVWCITRDRSIPQIDFENMVELEVNDESQD